MCIAAQESVSLSGADECPKMAGSPRGVLVNRNVNVSIDFVKVGGLQKNQALSDV